MSARVGLPLVLILAISGCASGDSQPAAAPVPSLDDLLEVPLGCDVWGGGIFPNGGRLWPGVKPSDAALEIARFLRGDPGARTCRWRTVGGPGSQGIRAVDIWAAELDHLVHTGPEPLALCLTTSMTFDERDREIHAFLRSLGPASEAR